MDVTVVSSMPLAIFDMVLAVAGYITKTSASEPPMRFTCSVAPVSSVIGLLPEANSIIMGVTNFVADSVSTGMTDAPWRISSLIVAKHSLAATLPVIPMTMVLPFSLLLFSQ